MIAVESFSALARCRTDKDNVPSALLLLLACCFFICPTECLTRANTLSRLIAIVRCHWASDI